VSVVVVAVADDVGGVADAGGPTETTASADEPKQTKLKAEKKESFVSLIVRKQSNLHEHRWWCRSSTEINVGPKKSVHLILCDSSTTALVS
jgi:hypothetical protein